ncbi:RNase H domain-containing protein [Trichonephila clavipes]|nr:RNase H domain-containing protein [Trichonephila clavipes]
MLEKVIENWTSRLDYIRASRGSPMPEIIFKIRQQTDRAGSDIYIEKRGERSSFCYRNPDFNSEVIAIKHGLEAVLNEQDVRDLWILFDSRGSLQHLYNRITVGDKAGVSILQKLRQISDSHDVHFQWIPSHVNIFGNEQADFLAKDGCNASPPISSTLTYSEHQSRVKSEILRDWRTPRPTITGMKANIQDPHTYCNVADCNL